MKRVLVKKLNDEVRLMQLCSKGAKESEPCQRPAVVEARTDAPNWTTPYLCLNHFEQVPPSRQGKYRLLRPS